MTNPPEKTVLEREIAEALLDVLDRLRDGLSLALDCAARDIERIMEKRDAPRE